MKVNNLYRVMLLVLGLSTLLGVHDAQGGKPSLPVLGQDAVANPLIVEDHSQALAHWAEQGVRGAILMNIDAHDDIRWIPDKKIDELRELRRRGDWQRIRRADTFAASGLYNLGNWIYAGARLGVFREIFWVVPFRYFVEGAAEEPLRRFLASCGFSAEEIGSFSLRGRRFHGTFRGIPLTVCGLESLPVITEPLLLSIDTDFFRTYSAQYRAAFLPALHAAFGVLSSMNYRIQDAIVAYSINGDFLHPHHRWVGDTIAQILRKPGLLAEPPSEPLLLLQKVENAYRANNPAETLALADPYLALHPLPSLMLYKAFAHMQGGDSEKAYETAMAGCKADRLYCSGAVYIGAYYASKGEYRRAERFFRGGFSLNPEMNYGRFQYANCLRKLGKLREAIGYYAKDEQLNGPFMNHFMIVETFLMLGDHKAATAALKIALRGLDNDPYAEVVNATVAHAVYAAIEFCDRSKFKEMAATLRNNPAIVRMFRNYPRN
jgi:tetratricopeptide (TPR) repeat protein